MSLSTPSFLSGESPSIGARPSVLLLLEAACDVHPIPPSGSCCLFERLYVLRGGTFRMHRTDSVLFLHAIDRLRQQKGGRGARRERVGTVLASWENGLHCGGFVD
jgi:hypothetical protein